MIKYVQTAMNVRYLLSVAAWISSVWLAAAQSYDYGDLPDPGYPTKLASNGPRHVVTPYLYLGSTPPDPETDAYASADARGDDTHGTHDEDGIDPANVYLTAGTTCNLRVKVNNWMTLGSAWLYVFVDWNHDGDFSDADEAVVVPVPAGSHDATIVVPLHVPANAVTQGNTALRMRLSTNQNLTSAGPASDGEVEDYFVTVYAQGVLRDWGDLPDSLPGTAPGTFFTQGVAPPDYRTRAADGGPSHGIRAGLNFGSSSSIMGDSGSGVDAELDGQPTADASGDNTHGDNDEGDLTVTVLKQQFVKCVPAASSYFDVELRATLPVTNTTGQAAHAIGFIDINSDGDFSGAGEQSAVVSVPSGTTSASTAALTFSFHITDPTMASTFIRYFGLRIRITTDATIGPDGPASDGEVHDAIYSLPFTIPQEGNLDLDFGDLDATRYPTLAIQNGARHVIVQGIFMGDVPPDAEADGQPDAYALGDNTNGVNDEDGFDPAGVTLTPGSPTVFPVKVTSSPAAGAFLYGFVDWDNNGDFNGPNERSVIAVPAGSTGVMVNLPFDVPVGAVTNQMLAVRLRLSSDLSLGPAGLASDGEVEDYHVVIKDGSLDFGDLPDVIAGNAPGVVVNGSTVSQGDYHTRLADNGPRHGIRPDLYLEMAYNEAPAVAIDAETDGQPTTNADGDDTHGINDEQSALFAIVKQEVVSIGLETIDLRITFVANLDMINRSGSTAYLTGYIDANNNGDFNDPGETDTLVVPSALDPQVHNLYFKPVFHFRKPGTSWNIDLPVRFRLSTQAGLGPDGPALDGEVNDTILHYVITVDPWWQDIAMDYGDLDSTRYPTLYSQDGARHVIVQGIFMGDVPPDAEADGQPDAYALGDNTNGVNDEDGFDPAGVTLTPGSPTVFPVKVTSSPAAGAFLYGFVDWDNNGDFNGPNERSVIAVPAGSTGVMVNLPFDVPVGAVTNQMLAVRLRLSSDLSLGPAGLASDGEVEDYHVVIKDGSLDFGDLPDALDGNVPGIVTNLTTVTLADYRTRLADNGPRHCIRPDLYFSDPGPPDKVDAETDGQPNGDATGDENNGADEGPMYALIMKQVASNFLPDSLDLTLTVGAEPPSGCNYTGSLAYMTGFLDLDGDGLFDTPGERCVLNAPSGPGETLAFFTFTHTWHVTKPISHFHVKAPLRARISTESGLGPDGPARDGEVEDSMMEFEVQFDPAYWDRFPNGNDPTCGDVANLVDQGSPTLMHAAKFFPANGQRAGQQFTWHIGDQTLSGADPLLDSTLLAALPTGRVPFDVVTHLSNTSSAIYIGYIEVRDLSGFRSFMGRHGLTGDAAVPGADADGDGRSNFMEYAFGSNPAVADAQLSSAAQAITIGSSRYGAIPYLRRSGGTSITADYATAELLYQPEASFDMTDWSVPLVETAAPGNLPTPPDGYEWGALRFTTPIEAAPKGFVRWRISAPAVGNSGF